MSEKIKINGKHKREREREPNGKFKPKTIVTKMNNLMNEFKK